ncbi:hypothetical protein BDD12DRAFT_980010 [Trichophaea hybrida]|nr:hypothetical protein BDD12DRAFT_980010 [Trichophaea hybrida]
MSRNVYASHDYSSYVQSNQYNHESSGQYQPNEQYEPNGQHESNGQYESNEQYEGRSSMFGMTTTSHPQYEEERENRPVVAIQTPVDYSNDWKASVQYMDNYPHEVILGEQERYFQLNRSVMGRHYHDRPSNVHGFVQERQLGTSRPAESHEPEWQILSHDYDIPLELIGRSDNSTTPAPHYRGPAPNAHPTSAAMERGNGHVHRRGRNHQSRRCTDREEEDTQNQFPLSENHDDPDIVC